MFHRNKQNYEEEPYIMVYKRPTGYDFYSKHSEITDVEMFLIFKDSLQDLCKKIARNHNCDNIDCKLELQALQTLEFFKNLTQIEHERRKN